MDQREFLRKAEECMKRVADALEAYDPDEVDYTETDGVVTLEFADGARFVLNRQTATDQMWYAAGARAWHYDWSTERNEWRSDKDDHELYARIGETISEKIGRPVEV